MLNSKDKIFTNLYGQESFALQMAYARGDWDNTKELMAKGADWIIDEVKNSQLRGRGGAGLIRCDCPTVVGTAVMPSVQAPESWAAIGSR